MSFTDSIYYNSSLSELKDKRSVHFVEIRRQNFNKLLTTKRIKQIQDNFDTVKEEFLIETRKNISELNEAYFKNDPDYTIITEKIKQVRLLTLQQQNTKRLDSDMIDLLMGDRGIKKLCSIILNKKYINQMELQIEASRFLCN